MTPNAPNQSPGLPPLDAAAMDAAAARQARLTKPTGALGQLEGLSIRVAGMTSRLDYLPGKPACLVFAADHGVTAQGVSAYPREVTQQMVLNFLRGGAAINVLARQVDARLLVVDAGVAAEFADHPLLIQGKVGYGTADFCLGPAMTGEEALRSLELGARVATDVVEDGANILALGEMGIGNTTSAAALIAALTGAPAALAAGRGTGVDDTTFAHKVRVIERALARHNATPASALACLGGFEIGAMAGAMIAAARRRVPILLDGVIAASAALVARTREPKIADYLIAGHVGAEPGHRIALEALGLLPLLALGLRLGEGTGALLALPLVDAAMRLLQQMATFDQAGVSDRADAFEVAGDREGFDVAHGG